MKLAMERIKENAGVQMTSKQRLEAELEKLLKDFPRKYDDLSKSCETLMRYEIRDYIDEAFDVAATLMEETRVKPLREALEKYKGLHAQPNKLGLYEHVADVALAAVGELE